MTDAKFGLWSPPEAAILVEYSLVVIEEIRQAVTEGFQKFSRGGIEVGGVLYGGREGKTVRVLAMREIACEHAMGPSFQLSERDRTALLDQIEQDRQDPRLQGMEPVGWFLSHTRSDIALSTSDRELFDTFFPESWQVTLVVRPGRAGAMRAGFFIREPDGSVKGDRSYLDFNFPDRLAGMLDRPARERTPSYERQRPLGEQAVSPERTDSRDYHDTAQAFTAPQPGYYPAREAPTFGGYDTSQPRYPEERRGMPWWGIALIVIAVIAAGAVAALKYFPLPLRTPAAEPISLSVLEKEGQLQIQWSHTSSTILKAASGKLEIRDGEQTKTVPLTPEELLRGNFTYMRSTGDVQVRLEVADAGGGKTQEASRFLGDAPRTVDANEVDVTRLERDSLRDEVTRLRAQNEQQAQQIQQLQRTLTILRTRLGINGK